MWFSEVDEFACQGSKVTPINIKIPLQLLNEKSYGKIGSFFFLVCSSSVLHALGCS